MQLIPIAVCAILTAVGIDAFAAPPAAPAAPGRFITRAGDKLMDGTTEFRAIGVNMPGLIMPYDFTLRIPERMVLPDAWEQEDAFKTLVQMNARVVRLWNLPMRGPGDGAEMDWAYVQGPGKFNEQSFICIDRALALANRYGVRIILPITADAGDYLGGVGTYAAHRGKKREQFWTDPQLREDYKATLNYFIHRKNTITGIAYKDDPAILGWQFGNEMRHETPEWIAEMAAYLKSIDANHLVIDAKDDKIPAADKLDEHVDVYTRHYYGGDWLKNIKADREALRDKRPLLITEFGLSADVPMVGKFLDQVIESGTSGALIWSMYFHDSRGGFKWHQIFTHPSLNSYHWPGFEAGEANKERKILWLLRDNAFAIQGLTPPAIGAPERPAMLPVEGGIPLLSWRGSVGAVGYDIQRSAAAEGPWINIAENVSDSQTAYRPLFSDTTATIGQSVYYRVNARNSAGASAPSAAIGPVKIESLCLIDELPDFSRTQSHTAGLTIINDHNALRGEYPFRAKGVAGESITYHVAGAICKIGATAFFPGDVAGFKIESSADGKTFQAIEPQRQQSKPRAQRNLTAATQVNYSAVAGDGQQWLRITWTGTAELDYVAIEYK